MAYKMLQDSKLEPKAKAGMVVYDLHGWDYGLASDDRRILGIEYVSFTLNENGDYPSFTVPRAYLEPISDPLTAGQERGQS